MFPPQNRLLRELHFEIMNMNGPSNSYALPFRLLLCYASADDRQHLAVLFGVAAPVKVIVPQIDIARIIDQADEKLFQPVLTNSNRVLSSLPPDKNRSTLLSRRHDILVEKSKTLFSNNFCNTYVT